MILTSNLGLKKAEITDNADLTVFISDNMDILDSEISSKADATHTHDYLPLSGGILTGDLTVQTKITSSNGFITGNFEVKHNATTDSLDFNYIG